MKEEWRAVPGYEGLYEVSNMGRVRSLDRMVKGGKGSNRLANGIILKPYVSSNGYPTVSLNKDGKARVVKVHRLVAMAFIPNPNNLPMINHKDECKLNNCVDNLEWCTATYNLNYGTWKERRKKKGIAVDQYDTDGNYVATYSSMTDAAIVVGSRKQNIYACLNGMYKTAGGYEWRRHTE